MSRRFSVATFTLIVALTTAACTADGGSSASGTPHTPPPTRSAPVTPVDTTSLATPTPSPSEPPVPAKAPPTHGASSASCVNGWVTPPTSSPKYTSPIGVIRRATGVRGPLEIVDMRYFEGPESPPSDAGYLLLVQRWYVKLFARKDYAFAGRFLVEARRFGQGLSAVAPYDSKGFTSPDWVGFQLSADATPKTYPGLPGRWTGIPYDFVKGGDGLMIPGLPKEVVGCLDGT